MKPTPRNLTLILFLSLAPIVVQSQVPNLITYHGRVQADGVDFNGTAQIKFALVTLAEDAAAAATAQATLRDGSIVHVTVLNPGSGFIREPRVSVTDPTGSGADLRAVLDEGRVAGIQVVNGGGGYTAPDVIIEAPPPAAGDVTHWSHDGTSFLGGEPSGAVEMVADEGMFSVVLGAEGMAPLDSSVLANPNLQLRVWVGDEDGFEQLTPDQKLTTTPYAMMAATLPPGSVTGDMIAPGSIETSHLSPAAQGPPWNNLDHLDLGDADTYGSLHIYHNDTGEPSLLLDGQTVQITAMGNGNQPKFNLVGLEYGHLTLYNATASQPKAVLTGINEHAPVTSEGGGALYLAGPGSAWGSILEALPDGGQLTLLNGNGDEIIRAFGAEGALQILQLDGDVSLAMAQNSAGGLLNVNGQDGEIGISLRKSLYNNGGEAFIQQEDGDIGVYIAGGLPPATAFIHAMVNLIGTDQGGLLQMKNVQGDTVVDLNAYNRSFRLGSISQNLTLDQNEIRSVGVDSPLYINANGNQVAIGSTEIADGFALSVDGSVICEELVVQLSGDWPDYVFAEDYALMPLEELEASIAENKHLPGIPRASEVEKDGITVGAMQTRMMEKIEELTLYLLEQNRQLKAQRSEIEVLTARLNGMN